MGTPGKRRLGLSILTLFLGVHMETAVALQIEPPAPADEIADGPRVTASELRATNADLAAENDRLALIAWFSGAAALVFLILWRLAVQANRRPPARTVHRRGV